MKNTVSILLVVLLVCPVLAAAGQHFTFTLPEAVAYGLKSSPSLKGASYQVKGAEMGVKSARGKFFPLLSSGYSYTDLSSRKADGPVDQDYLDQKIDSFNVGVTQVLYAGSRILNEYRRAEAEKEMMAARRRMTQIRLIYNIETAFFKLMKAREDVAAAEDTVTRLESGVKAAQASFEAEMSPWVEVLQARVELVAARRELNRAQNMVQKEKFRLLSLMNRPGAAEEVTFRGGLDYYPSDYSPDMETLWRIAVDTRPDLMALEKQKIMARREAQIAASRYLPTIQLKGGYYDYERDYDALGETTNLMGQTTTYDRDQENEYWQAAVSVQWNLFDGGSAWYGRQQNLNEVKQLEQDIIAQENTLKSQIKQAVLALEEATESIATASEMRRVAGEYYRREEERLAKSLSTTPAVLDALARLTRSEAEYNNALFDYQQAMADIKYLLGKEDLTDLVASRRK